MGGGERETISDDLPLLSLTLTCLEALERKRKGGAKRVIWLLSS